MQEQPKAIPLPRSHLENDRVLRQSLVQCIVPAFDVRGLAAPLAAGCVLRFGDHGPVRFPEIRVAGGGAPRLRHLLPQKAATLLIAVLQTASHDLPRCTVQGRPHPGWFRFRADKRSQLIHLQDRRPTGGGRR